MNREAVLAATAAALVVLAGCAGPPGMGNGSENTVTREGKVVVVDGDPGFDAQTMYERLLAMHGQDSRGAPQFSLSMADSRPPGDTYFPTRFGEHLDVEGEPNGSGLTDGPYRGGAYAHYPAASTCARKRAVATDIASRIQPGSVTMNEHSRVDHREAVDAAQAGGAAYAAERYLANHTDCDLSERSWATLRANLSVAAAMEVGQAYFGLRYVRERVDDVRGAQALLDAPPLTTEQVIHGYGFDEERPRSLSVDASAGGGWAVNNSWGDIWYDYERPQRMGELFVRVLLERHLDYDRAAEAAAGWGNDAVVRFTANDRDGYVWALRWDSEGDADEFAAAMADYLDAAGTATGDTWTVNGTTYALRRASPDTVVVVTGPSAFVAGTTVEGDGGTVRVSVGELRALRRTSGR